MISVSKGMQVKLYPNRFLADTHQSYFIEGQLTVTQCRTSQTLAHSLTDSMEFNHNRIV